MKTTDRIPLTGTQTVYNAQNQLVDAPLSRTVKEEIERLERSGMYERAQRLRNSCTDGDVVLVEEVDPTNSAPKKK